MRIQYFQTAWNDIKNSQGWFGKLCLLALVGLIPIFGQIVIFGYLYGWAREISWGVHEPLPAKIFGNEDGKLYRRGWFILLVTFVFSLIPAIISGMGSSLQQVGFYGTMANDVSASASASVAIGGIVSLIGIAAAILASILAWIGSMRVSIYDRLSTGFQLGIIWKMFRHETGGIMRIFGMNLLVGLILGILLSIIIGILFMMVVFAGAAGLISAGYTPESLEYISDAEAMRIFMQFIASAGFVGIICLAVSVFLCNAVSVFVEMLVARALGYWTWQFDVPQWRGKDDPLPFELNQPMQ